MSPSVKSLIEAYDPTTPLSHASTPPSGQSIEVADQVQLEDIAISESVQIGLQSRSYDTGRLSVAKESGEHLFHRLLHGDLRKAVDQG